MADYYVYMNSSQDDADATWNSSTLAFLNLDLAFDTAGAGDTIHVAHDHNYSAYAANIIYSSAGTWGNPVWVVCENRTTGAYAITAVEDTSGGSYDITLDGSALSHGVNYISGDDFLCGANDTWLFQDCYIKVLSSSGNVSIGLRHILTWNNVDFKTGHANNYIYADGAMFLWNGGSVIVDAVAPTSLFSGPRGSSIEVRGVDASVVTTNIVNNAGTSGLGAMDVLLAGLKVAAGITLFEDTVATGGRFVAHSIDNGDAFYRFEEKAAEGNTVQDTANYLNATYDGTNGFSAKMASNAGPYIKEWFRPTRFKLWEQRLSAANPTLTIETITAGVTLQDDEFWIEIEYPNSTDEALMDWDRTSRLADPNGTPSNLTTSTESWTEVLASEVKQKIAVTISGGAAGVHTVWANLAKPSTTVYIDPDVAVS